MALPKVHEDLTSIVLAYPSTANQSGSASTAGNQMGGVPPPTVARLPDATRLDYCFDVRQQWEGVVTSVWL